MTPTRIHEVAKIIGKLAYLDGLGSTQAGLFKSAVVGLQGQTAAETETPDPYATLSAFVSPALSMTRPVIGSLDRVGMIVRGAGEAFLRSIASELQLDARSEPQPILTALSDAMDLAGESVDADGGLRSFVLSTWGIGLPTDESPTIPESYVSPNVI